MKKAFQITVCKLFGMEAGLYGKRGLLASHKLLLAIWRIANVLCVCVCVCVSLRASYVKFVVPDIWWSHLHSTLHKSAPKQLVFRFVSGIKGRKNMNYAHDGRELRRGVAFNSGTRLLCLEPKLRDECSVRWGQTSWDASVWVFHNRPIHSQLTV